MKYFSVILPSYLGDYTCGEHESATNRSFKLRRAINSYLSQTFTDSELIIVSDGCTETNDILREYYHKETMLQRRIKVVKLDKQPTFSGVVRQNGLNKSNGKYICYLDSDDIFGPNHLKMLHNNIEEDDNFEWFMTPHYYFDGLTFTKKQVKTEAGFIGTSNFCHKSDLPIKWADGYGHDWTTIETVLNKRYREIEGEYFVCHVHNEGIDY